MIQIVIQQLWVIYYNTDDDDKKIKILNEIAQKCSLVTNVLGQTNLLEIGNKIKTVQKTHIDRARESHEWHRELERLRRMDRN